MPKFAPSSVATPPALLFLAVSVIGFLPPPLAAQASPSPSAPASQPPLTSLTLHDRVGPDGTLVRRQEGVVELSTPALVAQYAQIGFPYFESNDTATIDLIEVTKPDGRVLDLGASAPRDVAPLLPPNLPVFSDLRLLRAAVPSLEVGDRLRYVFSLSSRPLAPGHTWAAWNFAEPKAVGTQLYELDVEESSALRVVVDPELAARFEETRRDGRRIRRWTVSSEDAVEGKDGGQGEQGEFERTVEGDGGGAAAKAQVATKDARAKADPNGSSELDTDDAEERPSPDILVTSFASWDELGQWWWALSPPVVDDVVRAKAAELTKAASTEREKLAALHRFVAREIRYLTLPLGMGRYRAREVAEILGTGLGDCKDKIRLLASLAASVGIEVEPVLISAGARAGLVEAAPSPLQFDHVIGRVALGKGSSSETIWLDPTSEMTPFGRLPAQDRDQNAVAISQAKRGGGRGVRGEVVRTPKIRSGIESRSELVGSIDPDGMIRAKVRWTFEGDVEILRLGYHYGDDAVREQMVQTLREEWDEKAKITDWANSDPTDLESPLWVEYDVEWPMSATIWRKEWDLWIPVSRLEIAAPPDADEKGDPPLERLELGAKERQVRIARIELPEGVRATAPLPISVKRDFANLRTDYRVEGRTLVIERELEILQESIPRERFAELRSFREQMKKDRSQEFEIAAAPELGVQVATTPDEFLDRCREAFDAGRYFEAEPLCRRATELEPDHSYGWSDLGRALRMLGRLDEAEAAIRRQIEINPESNVAYTNLAHVAWARRDYPSAEKHLRRQIEVTPFEVHPYASLGKLLRIVKRLEEADEMLKRALKLDPEDEDSIEERIFVNAMRGHFEEVAELTRTNPGLPREQSDRMRIVTDLLRAGKGPWAPFADWIRTLRTETEERLEASEGSPTAATMTDVWTLSRLWEAEARADLEAGRAGDAAQRFLAARAFGSETAAKGLTAALGTAGAGASPSAPATPGVEVGKLANRRVPAAAGTQGELWLRFSAEGRLIGAIPVGSTGPRALAGNLLLEPLAIAVPRGNRAPLPLKLLAHCSASGDCTLSLEPPGQTAGGLEVEERRPPKS